MGSKKDPGRFTLRFNLSDPTHRKAFNYLMDQNRHSKANYIANAILHYEGVTEVQKVGDGFKITRQEIEALVRNVLASDKRLEGRAPGGASQAKPGPASVSGMGENEVSLIRGSLTEFGFTE